MDISEEEMMLVTNCIWQPYGHRDKAVRAGKFYYLVNQFWSLRKDGFASIDTTGPSSSEAVILETKWLSSNAQRRKFPEATATQKCRIFMNLVTSQGGSIEVALQHNRTGGIASEWSDWSRPITDTDSVEHRSEEPHWSLSQATAEGSWCVDGSDFKLRFRMRHPSSLYSFDVKPST